MAEASLTLKITIKWYAKPVLYFCAFTKLPVPNWVFTIHTVKTNGNNR